MGSSQVKWEAAMNARRVQQPISLSSFCLKTVGTSFLPLTFSEMTNPYKKELAFCQKMLFGSLGIAVASATLMPKDWNVILGVGGIAAVVSSICIY